MHIQVGFDLGDPLELLYADKVVHAIQSHGLHNLVAFELADGHGTLLPRLLGLLIRDKLVSVNSDLCGHLATVRGGLVKLLPNLEL